MKKKGEKAIEQLLKSNTLKMADLRCRFIQQNNGRLKKTLRFIQKKHRDLIVRVGGYCEFFVNLDKVLQTEIINRTLYGEA